MHADLDDIFLVMEGIGEWTRYGIVRAAAPSGEPWQDTVRRMMARANSWSQLEGIALFLLMDRYVPGWQARFLAPDFPSPSPSCAPP